MLLELVRETSWKRRPWKNVAGTRIMDKHELALAADARRVPPRSDSRLLERRAERSAIQHNKMVVGKRLTIRYCCESPLRGNHPVAHSEGICIEVPQEWFRKHSHIFGPAIMVFFFAIKLTGAALGVGKVFEVAVDFFEKGLTGILDSNLTSTLYSVLGSSPEKHPTFMRRSFGLQLRTFGQTQAWVCDNCLP